MEKLVFSSSCHFGAGTISKLADEINNRKFKKAFIITDDGLIACGIFQKVCNVLVKNKTMSVLFSDVESGPNVSIVKNAYNIFKRSGADFIIAIGGGSSLDTAKAVSVIATNPKYADVVSLNGTPTDLNLPVPVFAVPTTAGSAAEVSRCFVMYDEVLDRQIISFNDNVIPVATFIDAELMTTMPDIVTLSSGFDAFTHAIESLISKNSNEFTRSLSKQAIHLVQENLPEAYDNPDNIVARENMAYAGYMAGLAYTNSGLGICHSIAHALSSKIEIQHGVALGMTLPAVLKFNMYSPAAKYYKDIAEAFDVNVEGKTQDEICRLAIKQVEKFRNQFNMPKKLSDFGIHEDQLDILSLLAYEDVSTAVNPRTVTMSDIYLILKKLL